MHDNTLHLCQTEFGAMVFLLGVIILPIIGLIAFVVWAIFHELNHFKDDERWKVRKFQCLQGRLITILLVLLALMALPETIETFLSFFD